MVSHGWTAAHWQNNNPTKGRRGVRRGSGDPRHNGLQMQNSTVTRLTPYDVTR